MKQLRPSILVLQQFNVISEAATDVSLLLLIQVLTQNYH